MQKTLISLLKKIAWGFTIMILTSGITVIVHKQLLKQSYEKQIADFEIQGNYLQVAEYNQKLRDINNQNLAEFIVEQYMNYFKKQSETYQYIDDLSNQY